MYASHEVWHLSRMPDHCLKQCTLPMQVGLSEQIKGSSNGSVPKKVIEAPFVQIPLGVTEDRLVGTVDIEASMKVFHSLAVPLWTLLVFWQSSCI